MKRFCKTLSAALALLLLQSAFPMNAIAAADPSQDPNDTFVVEPVTQTDTHEMLTYENDSGTGSGNSNAGTCPHQAAGAWQSDNKNHWKLCGLCGQRVEEGAHTWNDWHTTTAVGCTTAGTEQRECTVCGKTETRELPALGHDWGLVGYTWSRQDGVLTACTAERSCRRDPSHIEKAVAAVSSEVTVPATCTTNGTTLFTAVFSVPWAANSPQQMSIPAALGHNIVEHPAAEPTCTTDGNEHYWECSRCGQKFSDAAGTTPYDGDPIRPATGHSPGKSWDHDDFDHWHICASCFAVIGQAPHAWNDWHTITAAGCTTAGTEQHECTVCGCIMTRQLPALGHNWGEPTYEWAADGSSCTARRICKTDPAHTEEVTANITSLQSKAPTCTEKGDTTYRAEFEADWAEPQTKLITADIPALGHAWGEPVIAFSQDGKTAEAVVTCQNDSSHTKTVEGVTVTREITTPATCTLMGTATYTATVTYEGHKYTASTVRKDVAIDPNNHNGQIVKVDGKAPTCTEKGVKGHYQCSGCGKLYRDADGHTEITLEEVTIQAAGHKWGKPVITFSKDGKTAEAVFTCETDKTHTHKLDAKVTSQVKTPATKETMGITAYTAAIIFEGKTYTATKDVQDIPRIKPVETVEKVVTQQLTEIPESLKDTPYNTVEKIEKAMEKIVLQKITEAKPAGEQSTAFFDVKLMITENGVTRPATKGEVDARGGITLVIPYPAGTNRNDFIFIVAHMLTMDTAGMRAGDIELPEITLTDAGLQVTLSGLSPVMVGYSRKAGSAEPAVPETAAPAKPTKPNSSTGTDIPKTGHENHMMLWSLLGLASACGLTGTVLFKKKKNAVK